MIRIIKNIVKGGINWIRAQARCTVFKRIIRQQYKKIEELEDEISNLEMKIERLQFELDRDDKQQRINYLSDRVQEQHIQKRELREEIKELRSKLNGKNKDN